MGAPNHHHWPPCSYDIYYHRNFFCHSNCPGHISVFRTRKVLQGRLTNSPHFGCLRIPGITRQYNYEEVDRRVRYIFNLKLSISLTNGSIFKMVHGWLWAFLVDKTIFFVRIRSSDCVRTFWLGCFFYQPTFANHQI